MTSLLTTEPTYPVPTQETPTAFADIVTAFFRNKRKIAVAVLVFLLLVTGMLCLRSKRYESRMEFLVRDEASAFAITSFDDHSESHPELTTETQIGTEIELLSGMELHREVISAMHPGLSAVESDRRLLAFNKELSVLPVPKTTLVSVTYSAPSKEEANATLATLSRLYLAYRAGLRGSDGAYAFFDQQENRFYRKLQEDQAALATFNQTYQVTLMSEEKGMIVHKLSDARATLYENEASAREAGKGIQAMLSARAALPPRITTQRRDLPDQIAAERLNSVLVDLENKRVELLTKYHPTDRHVQEVDGEIANTREALKRAQQSKSIEEQSDLNPIRQTVEGDLQQLTFRSAGLEERQRSVVKQVNEYEEKLQQLNQITAQNDDLTRKIREDEGSYDLYFKRREEARINRTLDNDKIANVRQVADPAVVLKSNVLAMLSIASICIIGVLLVVGAGILAGLWSPSFHSPWELENAVGSPVLATIPVVVDQNRGEVLARPSGGMVSLSLTSPEPVQKRELLEASTDSLPPQLLSPISRSVGGIDEDCFESGGAYLPLIEKLRKIDPSEPGGGTVFTFTACTRGEGVSHFVRHLGVELKNCTGKRVAVVNARDRYEPAMECDNVAPAGVRGRSTWSDETFLKQWFTRLRENHDYVLIDCPSLSASRAATIFGRQSDGLLIVVGAGQATRTQLPGRLALLSLGSVRVLGLALNKRSYPIPDAIYNLL